MLLLHVRYIYVRGIVKSIRNHTRSAVQEVIIQSESGEVEENPEGRLEGSSKIEGRISNENTHSGRMTDQ